MITELYDPKKAVEHSFSISLLMLKRITSIRLVICWLNDATGQTALSQG
jgi:hypothetical protein